MAEPRHLSNSPISEGLFDIRATLPEGFQVEAFNALRERLSGEYPLVEEPHKFEARVSFEEGRPGFQPPTDTLYGVFFKSADQLTTAQFRRDGFTLNRLRPYTSWSQLLPEALRLWDLYRELTHPESVPRIAVRYINDIRIPALAELAHYFTRPPLKPPGILGEMTGFLTQIETSDQISGVSTLVTQTLQKGLSREDVSILLDVDVFRLDEFVTRPEEIPSVFERLREVKNRVFFGSLTEDAIAAYE